MWRPLDLISVADALGLTVTVVKPTRNVGVIYFSLMTVEMPGHNIPNEEVYGIECDPSRRLVIISSPGPTGAFRAVTSLLTLIHADDAQLPRFTMADAPRAPYRGLLVDVARNFLSKVRRFWWRW